MIYSSFKKIQKTNERICYCCNEKVGDESSENCGNCGMLLDVNDSSEENKVYEVAQLPNKKTVRVIIPRNFKCA